jgi:hypothetical protein
MKSAEQRKPLEVNKKQSPFVLKKYLNLRNILIMIILFVVYIMFPNVVQPVLLIIIFYPLSLISCRVTKFVKYLNTELITPFTIFLGYVYGWKWAVFFGFFLGFAIWSQTMLNQLTIVNCFTYIYAGFFGYWASFWFPNNFMMGYLIAVTMRNVLTTIVFLFFNPDLMENITHTIAAFMTNTVFMPLFLNILYTIIMALTPH